VLSGVEEVPFKEPVGAAVSTRPRVVIMGSGWASMSMIKALPENIRCAGAAACSTASCKPFSIASCRQLQPGFQQVQQFFI
jgi:hypothetical protein